MATAVVAAGPWAAAEHLAAAPPSAAWLPLASDLELHRYLLADRRPATATWLSSEDQMAHCVAGFELVLGHRV